MALPSSLPDETQSDEARLLALLKELIAAQLVIEEAADQFAFRHALTQESIVAELLMRLQEDMLIAARERREQNSVRHRISYDDFRELMDGKGGFVSTITVPPDAPSSGFSTDISANSRTNRGYASAPFTMG